ncbi:MAG: hypothetical protein JWN58_757, partial [Gammaproteobacteria bacterium]|nr:hypothetical protein [Gammaproteobacteria bacterium]
MEVWTDRLKSCCMILLAAAIQACTMLPQ